MKKLTTLTIILLFAIGINAQTQLTFHDYSSTSLAGDTIHMSQYYGKKVMVVNCASFCVYTPQYTPLQQLYDQYNQYNFEIIGFPSNDFANQGGTDSQIITTCHNYNVSFLIMNTTHVSNSQGSNVEPVFQWLEKSSLNGVSNATVTWNFNKFLVDEAGHWVRHFDSQTDPLDTAITNWILSPSVVSNVASVGADNLLALQSSNPVVSSIDFIFKNTQVEHFTVRMYTTDGTLVGTLFDGNAESGQRISYPVSSLASGIYFVTAESRGMQKTYRCAVIK